MAFLVISETTRWMAQIKEYNEAASVHARAESLVTEVHERKNRSSSSEALRSAFRKFYPKLDSGSAQDGMISDLSWTSSRIRTHP